MSTNTAILTGMNRAGQRPMVAARQRSQRSLPVLLLRWLAPAALLLLGLATALYCEENQAEILWLSCASFLGCTLLMATLDKPMESALWAWVMLAVFALGFFLKANMLARHLGSYKFYLYYANEMGWLAGDSIIVGLRWTTVAFVAFCVTAALLLQFKATSVEPCRGRMLSSAIHVQRLHLLIIAIVVAFVITSILPPLLGFGQMGIEHRKLPFRLDAVVTRMRMDLIPILCLLLLWLLDRKQYRGPWFFVGALYVSLSMGDSFMRGSRSSVAQAMIPLFMLWILSRTLSRRRIAMIAMAVPCVLITFPLFTSIRGARMDGRPVTLDTLRDGIEQLGSLETFEACVDAVTGRVQGFDGLLHNLDYSDGGYELSRLFWLLDAAQLSYHQTYQVVGISEDFVEGRCPGLLGAFLIAGGKYGAIPLVVVYTTVVWLAWRQISRLSSAPVALSFFAAELLEYTGEGTFGIQSVISSLVSILAANYALGWLALNPRRSHLSER